METPMTPDEFAKRMKHLATSNPGDPEYFHRDADCLMMNLLNQLGYQDGVKIFSETKKFYS